MGFLDKLLGRDKKPAGEMTGDSSMGQEGMGMHQEQEGMADDHPAEGMAPPEGQGMPEHKPEQET